jgi:microcystin-dependent protein
MDPFIGEIRVVGFNFAPTGWFLCQGQQLPISAYQALFAILGTTYGGNGTSNFNLPNLQGNVPVHRGQGPGLSNYNLGHTGGTTSVALTSSNLTPHSHAMACLSLPAGTSSPTNATWAASGEGRTPPPLYVASPTSPANMAAGAIGSAGSGASHNNVSPYLGVYFIIAYNGVFPPHS